MRTCNSCGSAKPLSAYGKNKDMADGLLKICKSCMNAKQRARAKTPKGRELSRKNGKLYRRRHAKKIREQAKRKFEEDPERVRRISRESAARRYALDPENVKRRARESRERYPERYVARRKLNRAVESGRVVPSQKCEACGSEPGRARDGRRLIHGHHADYSEPLEVEWLCPPCHKAADKVRAS